MVLSMPAVEKGRDYTAQINDLYTFITGYIGSRVTGNDAGRLHDRRAQLERRNACGHKGRDP